MPLKAICFDVGDTLVVDDPTVEERLWAASQACGLDYPRAKLTPALRSLETFLLEHYVQGRTPEDPALIGPAVQHLVAALHLPEPDADTIRRFAMEYAAASFERRLMPGALDLLGKLRSRGFKIGIISDWETTLGDLLTSMAVLPLVDSLSVSAIVGVTKPDAALFRDALSKLDVDPADAIHIGDFYELDVAGARSAGMQALLFDSRQRAPMADCPRVTSFAQLVNYCLELPSPRRLTEATV